MLTWKYRHAETNFFCALISLAQLMHTDMPAMYQFSIKHATVVTCTEPPGRKATRKHGAFECLGSLCSRKNFIFTDLQSTAPTFPRVYIVYSLQVNCSKLILNTILRVGPFILQCLHIWMSATTTKTSTTFASHHSDVSCKHAERHRIETIIMDKD